MLGQLGHSVESRLALAMALVCLDLPFYGSSRRGHSEERPCLQCGVLHDHNNSWCSVKCHDEWFDCTKKGRRIEP